MVAGPALLGIVGLGAVGGIIANIALTPLTAGASLLQSYWYGSGLILGERMMYTVHWEQIKGRLDKGEDFLSVLDKIMNDDITAIANLSFKAMDVTGKLYLDKAGKSLAKFIEELLEGAINPFFSGDREEPPEPVPDGEPTPDGESLTIAEIKLLSTNVLQQMIAFPDKWTETTIAHVKTELASRNVIETIIEEQEEQAKLTFSGLLQEETEFQRILNVTTLSNIWQFLTTLPSTLQTKISSAITPLGYLGTTSRRTEGVASNEQLKVYFDGFARTRQQWYDNTALQNINFDLKLFQENVFMFAFLIHVHQLVYSR